MKRLGTRGFEPVGGGGYLPAVQGTRYQEVRHFKDSRILWF